MQVEIYDYDTEQTTISTIENFEIDFNNDFISSATTKIKFIDNIDSLEDIKKRVENSIDAINYYNSGFGRTEDLLQEVLTDLNYILTKL